MMKVLNVFLLWVFTSSLYAEQHVFEPYFEQKPLTEALGGFKSFEVYVPELKSRYQKSSVRRELDLPGFVDDLGVHEYRQRCIEVRNSYAQAMIYWSAIIGKLRCIDRLVSMGHDRLEYLISHVDDLRSKVAEVYTSDLYEKEHTLKYTWPLKWLGEGYVKSIVIGNQKIDFEKGELEKHFFKIVIQDDVLEVHKLVSDKEICLGHIQIKVEFALESGESRWFVSSYTF